MSDLDKLIGAMESGDDGGNTAAFINNRIARIYHDKGGYWPSNDVMSAYDGSLDAAKAMHGALLPAWGWKLRENRAWVWHNLDVFGGDEVEDDALKGLPARAWLIAILKAYRSQQC